MPISAAKTVRELAVELPQATRIFEKLGIDYCCGGGKSLQDACVQARLPVDDVLKTLEQAGVPETKVSENGDWRQAAMRELVEHIVTKHHAYVRQEIPRLEKLLTKVVAVHGQNHPELAKVRGCFGSIAAELTSHMMKEEMVLFPYINELESATVAGRPAPRPAFGTIRNPIRMMEMEHEAAGDILEEIKTLTSSYTPPEEACFSYRTLFAALKDFETDLHQHIHLENNILFPRAERLEEKAA